MKEEIGVVEKVIEDTAFVKVNKKDECSKCGMCLFPQGAQSVTFKAINTVNASVDDTVRLIQTKDNSLISVLLVFLVPLIFIGLAFLVVNLARINELYILLISAVLIIGWFLILPKIDKKIASTKERIYKVVEIIKK